MQMRSALFALLMLGACTSAAPVDAPLPATAPAGYLVGTKWRRVDDMNANPHGATMEFNTTGATGYTGCNTWGANVEHDGEQLRFNSTSVTERSCGAGVQTATEQSFLAVIDATRYAHYDRDALVLLDANQHVIARFDSELPPVEDQQ
jgi:heat shock protein HslJ